MRVSRTYEKKLCFNTDREGITGRQRRNRRNNRPKAHAARRTGEKRAAHTTAALTKGALSVPSLSGYECPQLILFNSPPSPATTCAFLCPLQSTASLSRKEVYFKINFCMFCIDSRPFAPRDAAATRAAHELLYRDLAPKEARTSNFVFSLFCCAACCVMGAFPWRMCTCALAPCARAPM